ncbi:BFP_1a_G0003280.mRNA.1.CDS.1 [Saccharomyces cerevisiae]|nr:BFP_1a_G0003280.mRNA.1.CDS.1 [Saccharomyces cerevisiae]CAI7045701.1 BFP_1a_G0003280.mRNA.1.CDS.1 [Saccharomyces cerevisiae]
MEKDQIHPRVLESVDTNSLSLLSSNTSSNMNSNTNNKLSLIASDISTGSVLSRPLTPPVVQDIENNSMLQWQFEKKEFIFDSNSTPSKQAKPLQRTSPYQGNSQSENQNQQLLNVRKRRSQLIGAKPKIPSKLYQSVSKLDLIDDKSFTSLPIAPPCNIETNEDDSGNNEYNNNKKRPRLNPVNELRVHNNKRNRYVSYGPSLDTKNYELTENTSQDIPPLVLVEDYIPYTQSKSTKKMVSISDLKSKLSKRRDNHIPLRVKNSYSEIIKETSRNSFEPNSLTLIPHILKNTEENRDESNNPLDFIKEEIEISDISIPNSIENMVVNLVNIPSSNKSYDDLYLSELNVHSQLRKCVICEKALYEISSRLLNSGYYKEIVCEQCTVRYEEAAKIFENCEFESSMDESNLSSGTFSDLENSAEPFHLSTDVPKKINRHIEDNKIDLKKETSKKKDSFSKELIERLQLQLLENDKSIKHHFNKDAMGSKSMNWFLEARRKLKWKWRINGLLPHFLRNQNSDRLNFQP